MYHLCLHVLIGRSICLVKLQKVLKHYNKALRITSSLCICCCTFLVFSLVSNKLIVIILLTQFSLISHFVIIHCWADHRSYHAGFFVVICLGFLHSCVELSCIDSLIHKQSSFFWPTGETGSEIVNTIFLLHFEYSNIQTRMKHSSTSYPYLKKVQTIKSRDGY